jgi:hypothetical protein
LTLLDISKNSLYAEGSKLLAEALKSNPVMTALNISSNNMTFDGRDSFEDMSGVTALADAMPGMGAMSLLNLSDNAIGGYHDRYGFHATPEGTDFILSHTLPLLSLSMSGPAAIAGAIRDMGALTSLNLSSNRLTGYSGSEMSGKEFYACSSAYRFSCSHCHPYPRGYRPCQRHPRYGGHIDNYHAQVPSPYSRYQGQS